MSQMVMSFLSVVGDHWTTRPGNMYDMRAEGIEMGDHDWTSPVVGDHPDEKQAVGNDLSHHVLILHIASLHSVYKGEDQIKTTEPVSLYHDSPAEAVGAFETGVCVGLQFASETRGALFRIDPENWVRGEVIDHPSEIEHEVGSSMVWINTTWYKDYENANARSCLVFGGELSVMANSVKPSVDNFATDRLKYEASTLTCTEPKLGETMASAFERHTEAARLDQN